MAPSMHPPCTPTASCTPTRCHPRMPQCSRPEACLAKTTKKGTRPCQSAASIMATRSKSQCTSKCGTAHNKEKIEKYLRRKSKEARLRKNDRLKGTHKYLKYQRSKGRPRSKTECCAGKGHRGRLKRKGCAKCCAACCSYKCRQNCQICCDECCCPCCGTYCSRYCTIL